MPAAPRVTAGKPCVPITRHRIVNRPVAGADEKAASAYAQLRCDLSLRHPDAIQLACAASYGVDLFITNDMRLQAKRVSGIQFIASLDRVPI